jgi:uncharacterized protein YggE
VLGWTGILWTAILGTFIIFMERADFLIQEGIMGKAMFFIGILWLAEVSGENDSASVALAVVTEDADLNRAASRNAEKTNAVLQAVKTLNLKKLKLKTTGYRVTIQRDYSSVKSGRITDYQVYNQAQAVLEGEERTELARQVSKIIGAGLDAGSNEVNQVQFYLQNRQALENQALEQATHRAQEKAAVLAKAAGVKLGRVRQINSQPLEAAPIYRAEAFKTMAASAGAPPLEAGESKISARVSVVYALE